ncbi:hypothetical protein CU097_001134, partial [Rhizopus azygosporus]
MSEITKGIRSESHLVRFLHEITDFSGSTRYRLNGTGSMDNPLNWLRQLERLKNISGVQDRELLIIARDHLIGKAAAWFDVNSDTFKTWDDFTDSFKRKYCSGLEDVWWNEIRNLRQGADEDIEDVDIKLRELFALVGVTDERLKIRLFLDAIHPSIAWEVERSQDVNRYKDLDSVVTVASRVESISRKYHKKGVSTSRWTAKSESTKKVEEEFNDLVDETRSVKTTSTMEELLKEFKDLKISIVKTVNNINGTSGNRGSRNFVCFYCKKEGHKKFECPEFLKVKQGDSKPPSTELRANKDNSGKEVGPQVA